MSSSVIGIFTIGMIILTTVPVLLVLRRVFGGISKQRAENERLLRVGIPTPARILSLQMGGMTITTGVHRHLQLVLQLEVQAPGRPVYAAALTTMVSELQLPQLQPGAMVQVRVDPANPTAMALEAVGQAQVAAASPHAAGAHAAPGHPPHAGAHAAAPGHPPHAGAHAAAPGHPPHAGAHAAAPGYPHGARAHAAAAPRMQYGAGPAMAAGGAPGLTPVKPLRVPAGAKTGMILGLVGGGIGVLVAIVGVSVNVIGVGLDSEPDTSTVCGRAVACCQTVTEGGPAADNCKNLGKLGVPEHACQSSLEAFERSAEAKGLTCE